MDNEEIIEWLNEQIADLNKTISSLEKRIEIYEDVIKDISYSLKQL